MCGIVGYVGKQNATEILHEGLKRLTYRGYDSWGFGFLKRGRIIVIKDTGDIEQVNLPHDRKATIGIGHTRWATNGGVAVENAHPHTCPKGEIAVVHNGIVENAEELKAEIGDVEFRSQTDTEVIAHLISGEMEEAKDFPEAVRKAFLRLEGRNAIVAMHKNFRGLVGVRRGSPLVVGTTSRGDQIIASDTRAFGNSEVDTLYLEDGDMAVIDRERPARILAGGEACDQSF